MIIRHVPILRSEALFGPALDLVPALARSGERFGTNQRSGGSGREFCAIGNPIVEQKFGNSDAKIPIWFVDYENSLR